MFNEKILFQFEEFKIYQDLYEKICDRVFLQIHFVVQYLFNWQTVAQLF